MVGSALYFPELESQDILELDSIDLSRTVNKYPRIFLDGEEIKFISNGMNQTLIKLPYIKSGLLEIRMPKITGFYSYDSSVMQEADGQEPFICDKTNSVLNDYEKI